MFARTLIITFEEGLGPSIVYANPQPKDAEDEAELMNIAIKLYAMIGRNPRTGVLNYIHIPDNPALMCAFILKKLAVEKSTDTRLRKYGVNLFVGLIFPYKEYKLNIRYHSQISETINTYLAPFNVIEQLNAEAFQFPSPLHPHSFLSLHHVINHHLQQWLQQDVPSTKELKKLKITKELLIEKLLEHSPIITLIIDKNGKIVFSSPNATKMFECSINEVLGRRLQVFLTPLHMKTRELFESIHLADIVSLTINSTTTIPFYVQNSGNKTFYFEALVSTIFIKNLPFIILQLIDVFDASTHEKRADSRLFETVMSEIPGNLLIVDKKYRIIYVSPYSQDIIKYSPAQLMGVSLFSIITEKDHNRIKNILKTEKKRKSIEITTEMVTKKDEHIPVLLKIRPFYIDKKITGKIISFFKLRELDQIDRFQQDLYKKFKQIIDNIPLPLVIINQRGLIIYINDLFTQIFGYQKKDILNQPIWVIVPPEETAILKTLVKSLFQRPISEERELAATKSRTCLDVTKYIECVRLTVNTKTGKPFSTHLHVKSVETDESLHENTKTGTAQTAVFLIHCE